MLTKITLTLDALQFSDVQKALDSAAAHLQATLGVIQTQAREQVQREENRRSPVKAQTLHAVEPDENAAAFELAK
jgi:hypothetical protein